MRVYIGPYKTWWGPYQIADLLQYIGVSDERCDRIGCWLADTWLNDLCQWFHKKYGERKETIRIDNYDVWDLDYTLALIIYPSLIKLKEAKAGTPYTDVEDAPQFPNESYTSGHNDERWQYILDEMIFAFKCDLDDNWDMEIYEKAGDTWTPEALEERRKIRERIENGHRLFGKYYNQLWT